jgi:hypothetical protein
MFYGCLSTDIKKSSVNWSTFPEEMRRFVCLTNFVTEWVFETFPIEGGTQRILPNCPEGDAYAIYYSHENKKTLETHLKSAANTIQYLLSVLREMGKLQIDDVPQQLKEKAYDSNSIKEQKKLYEMFQYIDTKFIFLGRVYLRIGLAMSEKIPSKYTYTTDGGDEMISYSGSVIEDAETAEVHAPFKSGYGWYDYEKAADNLDNTKVKGYEYNYDDEEDIPEEIYDIASFPFDTVDAYIDDSISSDQNVNGFMLFIEFNFGISEETLLKKPHLAKMRRDEFNAVENESKSTLSKFANERDMKFYLVKVKRDRSAMISLEYDDIGTIQPKLQHMRALFTTCSNLCCRLPSGSSIGITYGDVTNEQSLLKRVTNARGTVDYFGTAVNLAARMEHAKWAYMTPEGQTTPSLRCNRVAFGFTGQYNFYNGHCLCNYLVEKKTGNSRCKGDRDEDELVTYPFTMDEIPLADLNAGYDGFCYVLSKRLDGSSVYKVGSKVLYVNPIDRNFVQYKAVITELDWFMCNIEYYGNDNVDDGTSDTVSLRELVGLQKIELTDDERQWLNSRRIINGKSKLQRMKLL